MDSRAVFERNLARLRRRAPRVAAALEAADPAKAEVVVGPRGARTVSCEGVLLASAYDPEGEGERLAGEMSGAPADLLVAVGFALGHHVEAYRRRNPCPVIVFEPCADRLRAALGARDASPLLGAEDVHFATDVDGLAKLVHELYATGLRMQAYPHPSSLRLSPAQVREALRRTHEAKRAVDVATMTRVHRLAPWAELAVENAPELLATPSFSRLFDAFEGVPAVVAAAGPSLDRQLPLLARARERLLVIAIGQALPALRKAGIEPDLAHAVESQDVSRQFESTDPGALNLVLLPSVHPNAFRVPYGTRFVAYPAANALACWIAEGLGDSRFFLGGATVAQSAVQLAASAGANPILLIGQDLAYSDGRVYASGSAYDFMGFRRTADGRYVLTRADRKHHMLGNAVPGRDTEERELVWVPGWSGDPVPTSVAYASFIDNYREIGEYLRDRGVRLVNCTEGGARIPGLDHETFSDALEASAREPVRAAQRIRAAFDAPAPTGDWEERLQRARRALDAVERDARLGISRVSAAGPALRAARNPERKIQVLRGIGRCERAVRRGLQTVPWLDTFVQPAIHQALAAVRRPAAAAPAPETVVAESRLLFGAVADGIDRARELLDRFEMRIAAAGDAESH